MSTENFETLPDKFPHLGKMPPEVEKITKINPKDIDDKHLGFLDNHLESLQEQFPTIAEEINKTRRKIQIAMGLTPHISGEVMQAANNPDYRREYRSA